jgi:5-methylcytosine-specific restriction endonuclease McrA
MTKRRSITTAMRLRIWAAHSGVCHLCKLPINATRGELWHVEHIKPLWLGGEDTEANMAPAHVDCHAPKTRDEASSRAKTNRQRARQIGAQDAPKQPIASRGFARKPRPEKIGLPDRRSIYEDVK